jgi:hypothetical protein
MSQYTDFFLASDSKVLQYETLEISHPNMSGTYWLVRNARNGLTATLETSVSATFQYYPMRLQPIGQRDDLDQGFTIVIGDVGQTLAGELDLIAASANGFDTKPTVKYRTWRSDYLDAPLFGPVKLEIKKVTMTAEGASFQAQAPQLNSAKTGEMYRLDRFPMLRGLL